MLAEKSTAAFVTAYSQLISGHADDYSSHFSFIGRRQLPRPDEEFRATRKASNLIFAKRISREACVSNRFCHVTVFPPKA
jgi:hypothetical protein